MLGVWERPDSARLTPERRDREQFLSRVGSHPRGGGGHGGHPTGPQSGCDLE